MECKGRVGSYKQEKKLSPVGESAGLPDLIALLSPSEIFAHKISTDGLKISLL